MPAAQVLPDPLVSFSPLLHDAINEAIQKGVTVLVDQAPLETFVAQNTLQAYEGMPFHDAVRTAGELQGASGYLSEPEFLDLYNRGEITDENLDEARLRLAWPASSESLLPGLGTASLESSVLMRREPRISPSSRSWWLLNKHPMGSRALNLWEAVLQLPWSSESGTQIQEPLTPGELSRHLAGLPLITSTRALLVRYCACYLDRGMAGHHEPPRQSFWQYFLEHVARGGIVAPYGPSLEADARLRLNRRQSAHQAVAELLGLDPQNETAVRAAIRSALLRHPGWAGMFHRLERYPEERPNHETPVRLVDFLAALLLVEYHLALESALATGIVSRQETSSPASLVKALRGHLRPVESNPALTREPWDLCLALLDLDKAAADLLGASDSERRGLVRAIHSFGQWRRLALWQEALEANLRGQLLRALAMKPPVPPPPTRPQLEVMTCLDDREESFRRALEEAHPEVRTWGAPGFFQLPVAYKDLSSPFPRILCPLGVAPAYTVREKPSSNRTAASLQRTASFSRVARRAEQSLRDKSLGALIGTLGAVAAFPLMVMGLFFPRWREYLNRFGKHHHDSVHLDLPESVDGAGVLAFPLSDQVSRVGGLLRTIGLTDNFAPLVVVLGHGSNSANNPHKSAYDCGACRGHEGHNNARLLATLANRPEVRDELARQGLVIPKDTWFIGGRHDTCAGTVDLLDKHLVPDSHLQQLKQAVSWLHRASQVDAIERCRRFRSAPTLPDGRLAYRHVRERSVDPAQPRPELGHMTNAMVIIGRRWRSRGLFLDRRSFLVSYDSAQDPQGTILTNILRAITPIVVGINLQYYFSRVDSLRYGSGSKLPHNPVGLVGVMEGSCGDLRTGLPRQMVELHTPLRLLYVAEAPLDRVLAAIEANPDIRQKLVNQWCSMAVLDPDSSREWLIEPDLTATEVRHLAGNRVPVCHDSRNWFAGKSHNLPLAWIDPATASEVPH